MAWSAGWSWPAQLAVLVTASVLGALLVLAWLGDRQVVGRSLLAVLAVGLVALELGSYANHTRARRSDSPTTAAYLRYLHTHVGDGRVLDVGPASMLGDWGAALGIREIGTLDIMQIPWYRTFYLRYVGGSDERQVPAAPPGRDHAVHRRSHARSTCSRSATSWSTTTPPGPVHDVAARYPLAYRDPAAHVERVRQPRGLEPHLPEPGPARRVGDRPPLAARPASSGSRGHASRLRPHPVDDRDRGPRAAGPGPPRRDPGGPRRRTRGLDRSLPHRRRRQHEGGGRPSMPPGRRCSCWPTRTTPTGR